MGSRGKRTSATLPARPRQTCLSGLVQSQTRPIAERYQPPMSRARIEQGRVEEGRSRVGAFYAILPFGRRRPAAFRSIWPSPDRQNAETVVIAPATPTPGSLPRTPPVPPCHQSLTSESRPSNHFSLLPFTALSHIVPGNNHRDGGGGRLGLAGLGLGSIAAQDGRSMSCSVLMHGLEEADHYAWSFSPGGRWDCLALYNSLSW